MQKSLSPIGGRFNSYLNIYIQTTDAYAKTFGEKALTEGRAEGMLEATQKMLSANLPDAQIIAFTGLTQEQINHLKN